MKIARIFGLLVRIEMMVMANRDLLLYMGYIFQINIFVKICESNPASVFGFVKNLYIQTRTYIRTVNKHSATFVYTFELERSLRDLV